MKRILCFFGLHKWLIGAYSQQRGKHWYNSGYWRECEWCDKHQNLERPEKYHPTKYVWKDGASKAIAPQRNTLN